MLYSILLKLLYPTSLCLVLLGFAALFRKRRLVCRICFSLAVAVLLVCGNGWLVGALSKNLEWRNLPPNPVPEADCIVVLSGGVLGHLPPRPTLELAQEGNRILYGAFLFREHKAPYIICTGNVATGGIAPRPAADDMSDFLQTLGVVEDVVITETRSENTHEHAQNLYPMFKDHSFKRILLVTSARHMPRALGVFRRGCPGIEFIPTPTDFRTIERAPAPWYRELTSLVPTPSTLLGFSEVMHEYLGIAYYKLRGWI
jgi:uncharacterized SAM-binding protein YcdF (DUF218 family)